MKLLPKIRSGIASGEGVYFVLFTAIAAFITYCSMYAFRKPFTAATFDGLALWGIQYKILLILAQLIGYTISKFLGIKYVSELSPNKRIITLVVLMSIAWVALLLFGLIPYPYNCAFLLLNGLPLGMIWGVVFSFLEGRRNTELLGAAMASSFIVSSGIVKAIGKFLLDTTGITEMWMPFFAGMVFIPLLAIGIWMLMQIPPPNSSDRALRTERIPMNKPMRHAFFGQFALGIIGLVAIYVLLNVFRDLRDNFAVELWAALGYAKTPSLLAFSEIPIGVAVLLLISAMILIRNNRPAFYLNFWIIAFGGIVLIATTLLHQNHLISPIAWMIVVGFGIYLPYIAFHTLLFERWIALFGIAGNIGFLMYISDAAGYLGSTVLLIIKNFSLPKLSWLLFFEQFSLICGFLLLLLAISAFVYFRRYEKKHPIAAANLSAN